MTNWADDIAATLRNQDHAAQALRDLAAEKDKEIERLEGENVTLRTVAAFRSVAITKAAEEIKRLHANEEKPMLQTERAFEIERERCAQRAKEYCDECSGPPTGDNVAAVIRTAG